MFHIITIVVAIVALIRDTITGYDKDATPETRDMPSVGDTMPPDAGVAFSAHLANAEAKVYQQGALVLFDNIITNYGNAYNKITGSFTAPHRGLYFFTLYFMTANNHSSLLGIFLNNERLCTSYAGSIGAIGAYEIASCTIMKELQVGDVVNVKAVRHTPAKLFRSDQDMKNHHGFVGFLYKTL